MKCYTHHPTDAVAVCRSCGRALCPECVVEIETVCACKNRCEQQVASLNAALVGTKAAQRGMPTLSLFPFIMGAVFLWWGSSSRPADLFMLSFGGVFVLWGIAVFFLQMRRR
jgi:hypothetical protein